MAWKHLYERYDNESFTDIPGICQTMSRNRFEKLRNCLHVINEKPNTNDRLWKVWPVIDSILKRCRELKIEENLCVDEQMIPSKGSLNIKQYIKNKPNPWGIKAYLLCGTSGLIYDFIFYQDQTTEINTAELGCSTAVVVVMAILKN